MSDLVSLPEIERAAERIAGVAVRTPLVPFPRDPAAGPALLVKAESLQPIGAFKVRGAYSAIASLDPADRGRGVVTHSSGNHAQAVAYAARALGTKAVLVMPHNAPAVKVDACIALGAEVVYVEPTMQARAETAGKLASAHGFTMIPPFDDARVIAGQGTAGLEIVQDRPDVDVVLVPVSGGGLIAGVSAAVKALRPEARIIGVEPELAADARDSMAAGRPVAWEAADTGRTIADALRVQQVGDLPFAHMRAHVDGIVTVTEDEIRRAMRRLARETRLIAEPAGAVATAAYLYHRPALPEASTYVSILSGGNVDPSLLLEVLK
ncbi:threonine/serine dehydratase [Actinomadura darangshiensis]|uniref:threonine ammonia-lyase n=1 Tax=Actinomadura darangshiensis TaxID=705336 RepID=A0A4R5ALC0_9ACTN|nr:threonine/serine dehydratase [Actinomadura darangshiensis]TDD71824.1 threonine/serine dehydratase [Actinomadura darangshiensis]